MWNMRQGDEPALRSSLAEVLDSLQPVSPCSSKKAGDGWVLGLLQGPDGDMAHAFATAHQQPLWIIHKAAVEKAEIDMFGKNGDVQNLGQANISRTIP